MSTIECGICFLQYNEEERTPKMLASCGHTICQQCVSKLSAYDQTITCPFDRKVTQMNRNGAIGLRRNFTLIELSRKANQEQEKNSEKENDVPCPPPRKASLLNRNEVVNGLQKNIALLDLGRKANQEQEKNSEKENDVPCPLPRKTTQLNRNDLCRKEKPEQEQSLGVEADVPCFENPSHEAVVYCQQCEVDFCDKCFTSVHNSKVLSAHQKIKISEKPIKLPKCPKHPHNIAGFLCTDPICETPTKIMCQKCVLSYQHKPHKHDFLMKKLLENEKLLKDLLERNERFLLKKERYIRFLDHKEWEVTGGSFTESVQSISNQFDKMKEEAIHKLTQFANERKEKQTELKTRLEDDYSELKKVQNLIEKKLKMKNDLQNTDEITSLEKSHRSRINSQDKLDRFLDFEFIVPSMELQIKSKKEKE